MAEARLHFQIFGKSAQNIDGKGFNLGLYRDKTEFLQAVAALSVRAKLERFFLPKCGFSNAIAVLGDGSCKELSPKLVTTECIADCAIVQEPRQAVIMLPRDCPIVGIYDRQTGRIAVVHAGYRCLVRQDPGYRSILEVLVEDHGFKGDVLEVQICPGIGPCCFGVEKHREFYPPISGFPYSIATRGPREGQKSVDLNLLIKLQLMELGVKESAIRFESRCTACDGRDSPSGPKFYSYCYEGAQGNSNIVFFWLE